MNFKKHMSKLDVFLWSTVNGTKQVIGKQCNYCSGQSSYSTSCKGIGII